MHCHRNRARPRPRRRTRTTPGKPKQRRRPVQGCSNRTSVAAWLSFANDRRGGTQNSPISACGNGRRRPLRNAQGLASFCHLRGAYPRSAAGPDVPAPSVLPDTALAACEHRPSSGGDDASATAHRNRCGQAFNRYGLFCQGAALEAGLPYPRPIAFPSVQIDPVEYRHQWSRYMLSLCS